MTIRSELVALHRAGKGILRVEDAHKWAETHTNSALHKSLEWNDKKAGYLYRLEQIRGLIRLHIVNEAGEPEMVSLSIDRTKQGGGYRDIEDVVNDRSLREVLLRDAIAELERAKLKYMRFEDELRFVWRELDRVKEKILGEKRKKKRSNQQPQLPA